MYLRYPLFWSVARRTLVCCRIFWAAYRFHLFRSNIQNTAFFYPFLSELRSNISCCKNPSFVRFPFDGSNIQMKIGTEHWWNDTDRGEWSIGGMILTGGSGALVELY